MMDFARWKPRRDRGPATAEELTRQRLIVEGEITDLETKRSTLEFAKVELAINEPIRAAEAVEALDEINADLQSKRRTLCLIDEAIKLARKREAREAFDRRVLDQNQKTANLAATLKTRYEKAAHTLAAILLEIDEDHDARRKLQLDARELEVLAKGHPAEDMLRRDFFTGHRAYVGIGRVTQLFSWDGKSLIYGK